MSKELIDKLENNGQWEQALCLANQYMITGVLDLAANLHIIGRLNQRLGKDSSARRAYLRAIELNSNMPRTLNNLALLELQKLNPSGAELWLKKAFALDELTFEDSDLLSCTACEVKLFQLQPNHALEIIDQQLRRKVSMMALSNKAVCLHKLGQIDESVFYQRQAIALHLKKNSPQLSIRNFETLVASPCGGLNSSIQLQAQLMNLGIFQLSANPFDLDGQKLLSAGSALEISFWNDPRRKDSLWQGNPIQELIVWDDQGFGDAIQNLAWIKVAAQRVGRLRLWLRASLINLVQERFALPENCSLELIESDAIPWHFSSNQIGLFFLPLALAAFDQNGTFALNGEPYLQRNYRNKIHSYPKIGLVWRAGKQSKPQPERSARERDVPFNQLWEYALSWKQTYQAKLFSIQLDCHDQFEVAKVIDSGELQVPIKSNDWLKTAQCLDGLDLLVTIDTAVAHLAGAMGLKTILILSNSPDWRWGKDQNISFLYQSMRLCRCRYYGSWAEPLNELNYFVHDFLSK